MIRKKLHLKTVKGRDGYVLDFAEKAKLERLSEKYGMGSEVASAPQPEETTGAML